MTIDRRELTRFAWLSIGAAILTILLKTGAWWLTGSVGLLSDAIESLVNLVAALMALGALTVAARPADESHAHGYDKAEYFSSGVEGALILVAALAIAGSAVDRLLHPAPLEQVGLGLGVSVVASALNFGAARVLLAAGRRYGSITLEADAHHLMTDVWTSVGVVVGVGLVVATGWSWLDPVVAMLVAANIVATGLPSSVARWSGSWTRRSVPSSARRSRRCSTGTWPPTASVGTPCAPAAPPRETSSPSTSWSPARGP
jgi:cation diffusion facilitator family transporter